MSKCYAPKKLVQGSIALRMQCLGFCLLTMLLITLGEVSYGQQEEKSTDVYFWEYNKSLGEQSDAQVDISSYVKNSGSGLNRKTTAKFSADAYLFDQRISNTPEQSDAGRLFDVACHLNEGKLNSYTYIRVLGETKYKWETRTPKYDQEFMRTYEAGVGIPILTHAATQMTIDSKVSGSLGATLYMDSPTPHTLEGVFQPKAKLSAIAGVVANGPMWTKAAIKGSFTLLDYQFNGTMGLNYETDSGRLESFINVDEHAIKALSGTLIAVASFGPEANANVLERQLWKFVKSTPDQKKYEKKLLKIEGLQKQLDTFSKKRTIYITEPTSFEECVERSELLIAETREMINDLETSANSALRSQASRQLEQAFATIEVCKSMLR